MTRTIRPIEPTETSILARPERGRADEAVEQLGGLPELERYRPGSGVPPRFVGGTLEGVRDQLEGLAADLSLDGIIVQDLMTDHQARLRSYELLASLT